MIDGMMKKNLDLNSSQGPKRGPRMEKSLRSFFKNISFLHIVDESHLHSGGQGKESHFKMEMVSSDFKGKSSIQRHRLVMNLFKEEFKQGLHALSLFLRTEEEAPVFEHKTPPCPRSQARDSQTQGTQAQGLPSENFPVSSPWLNIVLYQPEIPTNTGNIGRICVAHSSHLHLVGPMGFSLDEKQLKRAGLDYWPHLRYTYYPSFSLFLEQNPVMDRLLMMTTKAEQILDHHVFEPGDWVLFGPETRGLPPDLYGSRQGQAYKIPMVGPTRSLNLANAVSMVNFEALRQFRSRGLLGSHPTSQGDV